MQAACLPPHRPWDCAINLLPGTMPPQARVHSPSLVETKAMEEYMSEALKQGLIRHSTLAAFSGFFFIKKRDWGLRPCINYRGLNAITVKYPHQLLLVPFMIEQLRGAVFYTKLDLRNAYNLVHIRVDDEWKTAFCTTLGHYQVMAYELVNALSVIYEWCTLKHAKPVCHSLFRWYPHIFKVLCHSHRSPSSGQIV